MTKVAEVTFIAIVIAVIWGMMSLPVVFYYIPRSDSDTNSPPVSTSVRIALYIPVHAARLKR